MQILLDPNPSLDTRNVLGRDAFQNVNDMLRCLATLQSGDTRPSGIKNGEFWCKDLDTTGGDYKIYRYVETNTPDGVQSADVLLQHELAQSINPIETARDDVAPSEKAVAYIFQDKISKSAISNAIDSESEENVASSFAVSALNKIKTDGKVTLKGIRTTEGLLTLTDLTPYKPVIVLCKGNITFGICGTYITTVSGGGTGDMEGHSYGIGSIASKFVSTNCYVVIPVSATVVLSFYMMGNARIEAYQ